MSEKDIKHVEEKYENTSLWIPWNLRTVLRDICQQFGVSQSKFIVRAIFFYIEHLVKNKELSDELLEIKELAEYHDRKQRAYGISKMRTAKIGWPKRVQTFIFDFVKENHALPPFDVEESYVKCGMIEGWSEEAARRIVNAAVLTAKTKEFGDKPLKVMMEGKTITHKREVKRLHSQKKVKS